MKAADAIRAAYRGKGTFHAVAPGNSFEAAVLRAVASLGGGSLREIGGGTDPAAAAADLVREIETPAVKGLAVSFEGASVAALYPDPLPNLPAGSQQIVVGRYRPGPADAKCTVTVRGVSGGKEVRFSAERALAGAEQGNSFVPRLWARAHLDHLLGQGSSPEIRARVVALSEDFNIMTPYTSFLVLESDEDRQRFQIQRRFRMRDAEDFFAEGRDKADFELQRKQMLKARQWRQGQREWALQVLAGMNRDLTLALWEVAGEGDPLSGGRAVGVGGGVGGRFGGRRRNGEEDESRARLSDHGDAGDSVEEAGKAMDPSVEPPEPPGEASAQPEAEPSDHNETSNDDDFEAPAPSVPMPSPTPASAPMAGERMERSAVGGPAYRAGRPLLRQGLAVNTDGLSFLPAPGATDGPERADPEPYHAGFPGIPDPAAAPSAPAWPKEVLDALASLDRRRVVSASHAAFSILVEAEQVDLRGRAIGGAVRHLLSRDAWASEPAPGSPWAPLLSWCAGGERGVLLKTWRLGRVRPSAPGDAGAYEAPVPGHFGGYLGVWNGHEAVREDAGQGRVRIRFLPSKREASELSLLIDPARAVLLEQKNFSGGKLQQTWLFEEFAEAGGAWWPTKVRVLDGGGRETARMRIRVAATAADAFARDLAALLAAKAESILLGPPPAGLEAARKAAEEGKATKEDRWLLAGHFAARQQWDRSDEHYAAFEALA
ncbi:MAG: hypothetical protein MUC63_10815, partial [Planctomycetes bacterium]|nr:hypothetical protein [Planctomycetota bacterium]